MYARMDEPTGRYVSPLNMAHHCVFLCTKCILRIILLELITVLLFLLTASVFFIIGFRFVINMCCCKRFTCEAEVSAFALSQNLKRPASSDVVTVTVDSCS